MNQRSSILFYLTTIDLIFYCTTKKTSSLQLQLLHILLAQKAALSIYITDWLRDTESEGILHSKRNGRSLAASSPSVEEMIITSSITTLKVIVAMLTRFTATSLSGKKKAGTIGMHRQMDFPVPTCPSTAHARTQLWEGHQVWGVGWIIVESSHRAINFYYAIYIVLLMHSNHSFK